MAPCISVNSLNCILKAIGSQCNRFSAAVMLCWSRRRKPRTTLAAARWTISSLCSNDPLIPQRAALPKSSLDVTSACTSVLRALTVRDDRIRLMHRSCAYAVRHVRLTCAAMDIAESSCTPRSRMLVDAMMLHPHTSMQRGGGCGMRLFGAANTMASVFVSFKSRQREASQALTSITQRRIRKKIVADVSSSAPTTLRVPGAQITDPCLFVRQLLDVVDGGLRCLFHHQYRSRLGPEHNDQPARMLYPTACPLRSLSNPIGGSYEPT